MNIFILSICKFVKCKLFTLKTIFPKERGGATGESSIETYTLPYVKEITSEKLLHKQGGKLNVL